MTAIKWRDRFWVAAGVTGVGAAILWYKYFKSRSAYRRELEERKTNYGTFSLKLGGDEVGVMYSLRF